MGGGSRRVEWWKSWWCGRWLFPSTEGQTICPHMAHTTILYSLARPQPPQGKVVLRVMCSVHYPSTPIISLLMHAVSQHLPSACRKMLPFLSIRINNGNVFVTQLVHVRNNVYILPINLLMCALYINILPVNCHNNVM